MKLAPILGMNRSPGQAMGRQRSNSRGSYESSRPKSSSMIACESAGDRAVRSSKERRGGVNARSTATGYEPDCINTQLRREHGPSDQQVPSSFGLRDVISRHSQNDASIPAFS